mmetsp:Transcript_20229/g.34859  ORF Transcript_20229/g.34859 Transcript_20229/m.34859 type:complete len:985 (+) Transcript_20229:91-3045(+)|eukprot:CAMPEP_0194565502 /NCGR_PEP_ID=MMETSP0292-20121207/4747_1 /TAXON_ID=39354 /ORGANISM="Heterosigma akashiwo, Strain CCMP2393" /LENGTH=984 /DNA_ID=CAMNT_0039414875 /DNA_START=165 /DNA_END=3119 /DNA_ORIENTATION=-
MAELVQQTENMQLAELEWPAERIRESFIAFFRDRYEHVFWPSSPVVPHDDPTLLFANAGMNQFKPHFLGTMDPSLPMAKLSRAVNSQKCIRAGGKHNDLDDVGKDVYHHTFFEMLGNWSFGAYFKREAIAWAWECLTEVFGLSPERLYATYFGGDETQGLEPDEEAREIWLQFLPAERVLPFGCKDNFWEMGDTGPCGPCTEIHYDRIGGRDAAPLVNADLPDVIEIWNNVFIQFNREEGGVLRELPNKHVDTGMGFERLASILQGKTSNYDTDIFQPIFRAIQQVTGARDYTGKIEAEDTDNVDMAYRVVADHIRTLTFAITDGAVPSSDGRGYVLRRVLRRGVRYGQQVLGGPPGFFHQLVPVVVGLMKGAFPELEGRQAFVMDVIKEEEESFNKTLDKGLREFNKIAEQVKAEGKTVFPGDAAQFLYATMGFPVDLTTLMAEEQGLTLDAEGFEAKMEEEREKSKEAHAAAKSGGGANLVLEAEQTSWLANNGVAATDSAPKYLGAEEGAGLPAVVVAIFKKSEVDNGRAGFVDSATAADGPVGVLLDRTAFYAESGGQIFDTGAIAFGEAGEAFEVGNCQTFAGYDLHVGEVAGGGSLAVGAAVRVGVDYARRARVAPNHTMTHVLNFALREVLLGGVTDDRTGACDQKGSAVDAERLRFDFAWNGPLEPEQLARVEAIVNEKIAEQLPVYAEVSPFEQACQIPSLRRVFGERYPDPVRVISVGAPVGELLADPLDPKWNGLSIEFCGGTHLTNTGQAAFFQLMEESGIAKGIRRVIAVTRGAAEEARDRSRAFEAELKAAAELEGEALLEACKGLTQALNPLAISVVDKNRLREELGALATKVKAWKKKQLKAMSGMALGLCEERAKEAREAGARKVVLRVDFGCDGKVGKKCVQEMHKHHPEGVFMVLSADEDADRFQCYAMIPGAKEKGLDANAWLAAAMDAAGGGKSGGKPDNAMGTVNGCSGIDAAAAAAEAFEL